MDLGNMSHNQGTTKVSVLSSFSHALIYSICGSPPQYQHWPLNTYFLFFLFFYLFYFFKRVKSYFNVELCAVHWFAQPPCSALVLSLFLSFSLYLSLTNIDDGPPVDSPYSLYTLRVQTWSCVGAGVKLVSPHGPAPTLPASPFSNLIHSQTGLLGQTQEGRYTDALMDNQKIHQVFICPLS